MFLTDPSVYNFSVFFGISNCFRKNFQKIQLSYENSIFWKIPGNVDLFQFRLKWFNLREKWSLVINET